MMASFYLRKMVSIYAVALATDTHFRMYIYFANSAALLICTPNFAIFLLSC